MIKSLRSLCLLKIWRREETLYEDLPAGLVRDLKVMKLFNGNFGSELNDYDEEGEDVLNLFALTILFDGVSWYFGDRSESFNIYCCKQCSGVCQPDLFLMMVTEGELLRDVPPFSQVREWLDKVESRKHDEGLENDYDYEGFKELDIKIVVDIWQDGLSGKIVFHGTGDSVSFEVEMEVEFTSAGSREITLHGKVSSGLETMQFENMLQEAAVSAQNAFQEYDQDYDDHEGVEIESDETEEEFTSSDSDTEEEDTSSDDDNVEEDMYVPRIVQLRRLSAASDQTNVQFE